ncbi:hypothetical protein N9H39_01635 [Gammaproteobacteria bacterium]|nr:hypothetical protein [Gammaproteobacteria bacterium]
MNDNQVRECLETLMDYHNWPIIRDPKHRRGLIFGEKRKYIHQRYQRALIMDDFFSEEAGRKDAEAAKADAEQQRDEARSKLNRRKAKAELKRAFVHDETIRIGKEQGLSFRECREKANANMAKKFECGMYLNEKVAPCLHHFE